MTDDPVDVAAAVTALKALANPARLRIALHLLSGERSVGQIEADLAIKQPNLSQHLAELRDAGLVATRREIRSVFYALADSRTEALLSALLHPSRAAPALTLGKKRPRPRHLVAASTFATVEP